MIENEIKAARLQAGLTQKQTAEYLGIPLRTIRSWEQGTRQTNEFTKNAVIEKLKSYAERIKNERD